MSQKEPTQAYVYQPYHDTGEADPRIYAIGGPANSQLARKRFTKSEAEAIVEIANSAGKFEPCGDCGADYPRRQVLAGEVYCKPCRTKHSRWESERCKETR